MQVSLNTAPGVTAPSRVKLIPLAGQALPLSPDGSPPTDFTLIAAGPMHTEYGTFQWTARSGRSVAEQWAKRNRRFMWDYEHFSTKTDKEGKPITDVHARRAAGNSTPLADARGFHMKGQSWTPDAAGYIRNGEFIYYSPVIGVDEATGEIIDVLKSALTNDPATLGCAPLMLSADTEFTTLSAEMSAAVGHVVADGVSDALAAKRLTVNAELAPDSAVPADNVRGIGPQPPPCGDSSMKPGEAADGKLPGLYERETYPSVPGSKAAELTTADAAALGQATHGPPPSVALTDPSVNMSTTPTAPIALSADSDNHVKAMAEHPHGSPAKHNVASVLVHNADTGHTLWGRRHDSGKYTAPGGHVKEGEHPVDGAVRELKEETGLDLPRHHMSYMGTMRLSHPSNGAPMDVHGYSCSVPSHVKPDHEKDADKEVKGWEWHAEHPLSEMHAPINALSVLSAKHGGMQGMQNKMHPAMHPAPSSETPNEPFMALDDNDSEMMDMNTLKALTATFISSGSSEGLTPEVGQKLQVALSAVKALDDALTAVGQKDGPVDLGALISLSETVAEKTGAKTGQVGAIISLAARAEAQPLALQLSTEQLKANFIELAFNGGRINGKTRQDVTAKIKSLSLADCEQLNKGPKIYEAPNSAPAPQGDNSATRTVELGTDNGQRPAQGITAEVPADLVGKKVELTSADLAAIASAKQNGVTIDPAKVLASKQALAAQGNKGVRVMQHPGSRQ
jgi:8-oxo-dGTP pyrophosphatase MutT (NUDIX family)